MGKPDILTGTEELIYDAVFKHTKIHRQFTRLKDIAREMGLNSKTVAGDRFCYIDGFLSSEEFDAEKKYWEMEIKLTR